MATSALRLSALANKWEKRAESCHSLQQQAGRTAMHGEGYSLEMMDSMPVRPLFSSSIDDASKFAKTRSLSTALGRSPQRVPSQVGQPRNDICPDDVVQPTPRYPPYSTVSNERLAIPCRSTNAFAPTWENKTNDSSSANKSRCVVIIDDVQDYSPNGTVVATAYLPRKKEIHGKNDHYGKKGQDSGTTMTAALSSTKNAATEPFLPTSLKDKKEDRPRIRASTYAIARSLRKSRIERASKAATQVAPVIDRVPVRPPTAQEDRSSDDFLKTPVRSNIVLTHQDTRAALITPESSRKLPPPSPPRLSKYKEDGPMATPIIREVNNVNDCPNPSLSRLSQYKEDNPVATPITFEVNDRLLEVNDGPTLEEITPILDVSPMSGREGYRLVRSLSNAEVETDRMTTRPFGPPVCITVTSKPSAFSERQKQHVSKQRDPEYHVTKQSVRKQQDTVYRRQRTAHILACVADEDELLLGITNSIESEESDEEEEKEEEEEGEHDDASAPTMTSSHDYGTSDDSSFSYSETSASESSSRCDDTETLAEESNISTGVVDKETADAGVLSRTFNMFMGNMSIQEWGIGCQLLMCTSA
eukprot:scaffold3400_cov169-Amphora_coffeaeformis.AAC.21